MILKMFCILDTKTDVFSRPFYSLTTAEAIRTFSDAVNEPGSPYFKHPTDYFLYEIGAFEDSNATVDMVKPLALGCASEFHATSGTEGT